MTYTGITIVCSTKEQKHVVIKYARRNTTMSTYEPSDNTGNYIVLSDDEEPDYFNGTHATDDSWARSRGHEIMSYEWFERQHLIEKGEKQGEKQGENKKVIGEYYSHPDGWIFIHVDPNDYKCNNYAIFPKSEKYFPGKAAISCVNNSSRLKPATPEEKAWLNACIAAGKYLSKAKALQPKEPEVAYIATVVGNGRGMHSDDKGKKIKVFKSRPEGMVANDFYNPSIYWAPFDKNEEFTALGTAKYGCCDLSMIEAEKKEALKDKLGYLPEEKEAIIKAMGKFPVGSYFKSANGNTGIKGYDKNWDNEKKLWKVDKYETIWQDNGIKGVHSGNGWLLFNGTWATPVVKSEDIPLADLNWNGVDWCPADTPGYRLSIRTLHFGKKDDTKIYTPKERPIMNNSVNSIRSVEVNLVKSKKVVLF